MSTIRDLAQLGKHVAARHGWAAARAFKSYEMSEADGAVLSRCAVDLLKLFPPGADASASLSAALAVSLERRSEMPVQVVAGTLAVEGTPVFGNRMPFDGKAVFAAPGADWNGHVWAMIGPYVVDISLFRAAYSRQGPALLSRHVDLTFGPGKALYVDLWRRTARRGLSYEPHYVLGPDEVTRLMGEAYHAIQQG
jgi:hypothetical protein